MEDIKLTSESTGESQVVPEEYKRPFQCPVCGTRFGSQENLNSHKIIHQSDGIIKCSICEKHFDNVQGLIAHNVVHSKKKYKCQLCDVWFKTSGNLKEHMKVHKGLVFKCSHCGKDFNKIGNLRLHEMRHTKSLKEFKCDLCTRVFSQKCLLKYHMRTHNGDKPYKCTDCDSAFADKSNLKKHFRIHSGEKPFSCEQCEKSFNQKSSLTCHRRTHVTFKPHECIYCGKRFGLNEELIVHLRVHGENRMFKCNVCDEEFIEHCYLKSHMRIHDMKTAGNKSVQVYASTDINTEEPTCLISVNGDVNVLESIVLKKRQHYNASQKRRPRIRRRRRRPCTDNEASGSNKQQNNQSTEERVNETFQNSLTSLEQDVKHCVSKEFIPEIPLVFPNEGNDFKTEIKQEFEETVLPFVNVLVKVELGEHTYSAPELEHDNEESSDQSNFEFFSQTLNSDSDDEKPLIQRIDWKHRLESQFRNKPTNPMDKFKQIIESSFPVVLVERLQSAIVSTAVEIKCERNSDTDVKANESINEPPYDLQKDIKMKKHAESTAKGEKETSLYQCSYCSKEMKTWPNLIMHEKAHRQTFECPTCKLDCCNITNLIKHTKECSRENGTSFTCSMCDNGVCYRNQAALNYHVTKHTGLRPFSCDVCQKTFRSKETLRQHMDRHKSTSNYNCEICGRGFPNKNHLKQHQLSHTDLKPFQCDICNNFFKSQGRLYNHKKIHMKPQYSCCYCSKEFTIIGNLKIHEKRHMSSELIDKFECEICAKQFILKHDLKYHMRKHNGERPYPCSLCPSRFADISNLHKHVKIHTGDKPFVCHCGKSYNQQSSLNTHKKTHLLATLFESFTCSYCPKKFALEEDLTLHLRSHGINSMFKCNFCDKEYELLNHMKSHRRIHLNLQLKRKPFKWPEKIDVESNEYGHNGGAMKVES